MGMKGITWKGKESQEAKRKERSRAFKGGELGIMEYVFRIVEVH